MAQSYTIEINEAQRIALMALIANARKTLNETDNVAMAYWDEMLEGLPAVEAEYPKIIHGFCL